MGVNDAREQLEVAKAEVVRLEQRVAELQALSARWAEVVNAPSFEAAVEADARAYHDSACAYRQERDSLARLHEVATERTVQLAAVIEKARTELNLCMETACGNTLESVDTDAALRAVRETVWEEGWEACEEAHDGSTVSANPKYHVNPYRQEGGNG